VRRSVTAAAAALAIAALIMAPARGASADAPRLSVMAQVDDPHATAGEVVAYTVTVRNDGRDRSGAMVRMDLPAGLIGARWHCVAAAPAACGQDRGRDLAVDVWVDLPPGAAATLTARGLLTPAALDDAPGAVWVVAQGARDAAAATQLPTFTTPVQPVVVSGRWLIDGVAAVLAVALLLLVAMAVARVITRLRWRRRAPGRGGRVRTRPAPGGPVPAAARSTGVR
jgi:uncharacterized repeat protein (TIGR01451 family)